MSRGKYSPFLPTANKPMEYFKYNCYGDLPPERKDGEDYDSKLHFADYDENGYDMYGYSAFDINGEFVGHGRGIDRDGTTEDEYMDMDDDEWDNVWIRS